MEDVCRGVTIAPCFGRLPQPRLNPLTPRPTARLASVALRLPALHRQPALGAGYVGPATGGRNDGGLKFGQFFVLPALPKKSIVVGVLS